MSDENVVVENTTPKLEVTEEQKKALDSLEGLENEPVRNSDSITLGGENIIVSRLKAKDYFEAQKVFLEIVSKSQRLSGDDSQGIEKIADAFKDLPEDMAKMVAICSGKTYDDVASTAFPEEIPLAFGVVVSLNRFMVNLKKFAAPFLNLGAK